MCWIFHKWDKWEDLKTVNLYRDNINDIVGIRVIQERRCLKCNAAQIKKIDQV